MQSNLTIGSFIHKLLNTETHAAGQELNTTHRDRYSHVHADIIHNEHLKTIYLVEFRIKFSWMTNTDHRSKVDRFTYCTSDDGSGAYASLWVTHWHTQGGGFSLLVLILTNMTKMYNAIAYTVFHYKYVISGAEKKL